MNDADLDRFKEMIHERWPNAQPSAKAIRYLNQFFDCKRLGTKITAKVEGNHGTYTVSITLADNAVSSACSCYIGQSGYCHHCEALAFTFLRGGQPFEELVRQPLDKISDLPGLQSYLEQTSLASLLEELGRCGVTQKAFAASIGMSSRHLSSIKSSESRNRYHRELGAVKVACLWVIEQQKPWR